MYEHLLFLFYWLLNSLSIYFLATVFPESVVLGNFRLTPFEASIYSGFWLTFFVWTMWDFVLVHKVKLEPFSIRTIFFFFVNSLGVWLTSRYSQYTGLGITNFWWAFFLGAVAYLLQSISWKLFGKKLKA